MIEQQEHPMGMKRIVLQGAAMLTTVLAATAAAAAGPAGLNNAADIKSITAIEQQLAVQPSMKNLIQYYADDALVLDVYAPGYYRGKQQIYGGFEPQFEQAEGFTGEIADMNIVSHGSLACAALQLHFHYKLKSGQEGNLTFRQLDAFRKSGGKWLIVQQHISEPTDPKTGLGLADARMPVRGKLAWVPASFSGPAVSPAQAKKEITAWLHAGVLSPDTDALMKYYGPSDDVIVYDVVYPPGEFRGLKEVRDGFAPVMNFTDPKVKILDLVIDSDGVLGVQIDIQDVTITQKDGSKRNFMLRQSDCLRRSAGRWYSLLEAISMPMDPKTGKAVSDPATFVKP